MGFYAMLGIWMASHPVQVIEDEELKTAFCTPYEHYEYTFISFGLVNALVASQSFINATVWS